MDLTRILGTEPVADAEEEAFVVFSQEIPSRSLGFVDSQASTLDISVAGYDLVVHQSPGLLNSNQKEGTTGAVLWSITPLLAQWLSSPTNFLTTHSLLHPNTTILELGTGISGLLALTLSPKISLYTATDQPHILKHLQSNIARNLDAVFPLPAPRKSSSKHKASRNHGPSMNENQKIQTSPLDWEKDDVSHFNPVDIIIACDCIYNDSLIEPLNATCAALCRLRSADQQQRLPTLCLVAQQLRSPDVFEAWLQSFGERFVVWRVPGDMLGEGLGEGSGFVVHVGILR